MICTDTPTRQHATPVLSNPRRMTDFANRLIVELGSRVVSETDLPRIMSVPDIHAHVVAACFRKYPGRYRVAGVYLSRGTARVTLLAKGNEG